jgi:hypothetical protein
MTQVMVKKKRPRIKVSISPPTTKSQEFPRIACMQRHATYHWNFLNEGYNFASNLASIEGLHKKLCMGVQNGRILNFKNFGTPNLGVPRKMTFGCNLNWLPNSMPFKCFWTTRIFSYCSYDWSINVLATFCNSTCLTILVLMWKGTKGQSMTACPSSS